MLTVRILILITKCIVQLGEGECPLLFELWEVKQGVRYNSAFRLAGWFLGKQFLEEKSGGKPVGEEVKAYNTLNIPMMAGIIPATQLMLL